MVPGAGIEPARLLEREILSLLCLPISPSGLEYAAVDAALLQRYEWPALLDSNQWPTA